jgi:hypothetical protein
MKCCCLCCETLLPYLSYLNNPQLSPAVTPVSVSVTSMQRTQLPSKAAFQRETSLSPEETARMLPVTDQETRQTGLPKEWSCTGFQAVSPLRLVHMSTRPSSPQLATVSTPGVVAGAQATSLRGGRKGSGGRGGEGGGKLSGSGRDSGRRAKRAEQFTVLSLT